MVFLSKSHVLEIHIQVLSTLMKSSRSGIGSELIGWAGAAGRGGADGHGRACGSNVAASRRLWNFPYYKVLLDLQRLSWSECYFAKIKHNVPFYNIKKTQPPFPSHRKAWSLSEATAAEGNRGPVSPVNCTQCPEGPANWEGSSRPWQCMLNATHLLMSAT